jgi:hypothetical protein
LFLAYRNQCVSFRGLREASRFRSILGIAGVPVIVGSFAGL